VIGDGSFIGAPDPETLEGPGSLVQRPDVWDQWSSVILLRAFFE
jgi:hypothetical protein